MVQEQKAPLRVNGCRIICKNGVMRFNAVAAVLFCLSIGSFAQTPQKTKLSQFAAGVLSGNTYTNDDLGITFLLPNDWTAKVDPQMQALFSPEADAPANRCTRMTVK